MWLVGVLDGSKVKSKPLKKTGSDSNLGKEKSKGVEKPKKKKKMRKRIEEEKKSLINTISMLTSKIN